MQPTPQTLGLAAADMVRQFDEGSVVQGAYSLSSMWRAAGKPTGKQPSAWLHLAKPLVTGLEGYFEKLDQISLSKGPLGPGDALGDFVVWRVPPGAPCPEDTIQPNDSMGTYLLALAYATYLDADNSASS